MAWRSDPDIYQGFYQQTKPLIWNEHINWLLSRNDDWRIYIVILDGRRIGVVTIGQLDYWESEIGIYIGKKSLWGKGIGRQAVALAIEWLRNYGKRYIRTTILDSNKRSAKMFESLGFKRVADARPMESLYRLVLTNVI